MKQEDPQFAVSIPTMAIMAVCFLMPSTPEVRRFQHNLQLRLYFVVRLLLWILSSTEANEALSCDTCYLYGTLAVST